MVSYMNPLLPFVCFQHNPPLSGLEASVGYDNDRRERRWSTLVMKSYVSDCFTRNTPENFPFQSKINLRGLHIPRELKYKEVIQEGDNHWEVHVLGKG